MTVDARPSLWARIYRSANWILIVLFMLLAAIHVVLTVLFYLGIWDTGVGYVLSYQWPAWLVTITDAAAATSLWLGYRRGADAPWLGLALTLLASAIMLARAIWMVLVPILVVVTIAGSIARIRGSRDPLPSSP